MSEAVAIERQETIRLVGVVRAAEPPPRRWQVKAGGAKRTATDEGELIVDVDGAPVTIAVGGNALLDSAAVTEGAWGELAVKSGGRFPASLAPAFARASLAITTVAVGAPVAVYGVVAARNFADDGGPREAPTTRVTRVTAFLVCSGDDADRRLGDAIARQFPPASRPARPSLLARWIEARRVRRLDPRSNDPSTRQYQHEWPELIAVGFWSCALAMALVMHLWSASRLASATAFAAAAGVALFWPTPPLRIFHAREARHGLAWHPSEGWWVAGFGVFLGVTCALLPLGPTAVYVNTAVMIAGALQIGVIGEPTYSRHRTMLRTPAWTGALETTGRFEGIVRDPTPVTVGNREVAIGRGTGYDETIGSNPDKIIWHRFHGDDSFLVDTAHGTVELSPLQVVWATTIQERVPQRDRGADYEIVEVIPVGAKVLASGRIGAGAPGGPPRLLATGTTPGLLVATSSVGDPRGWLQRLAVWRAIRAVALVGIGVGNAISAGWIG